MLSCVCGIVISFISSYYVLLALFLRTMSWLDVVLSTIWNLSRLMLLYVPGIFSLATPLARIRIGRVLMKTIGDKPAIQVARCNEAVNRFTLRGINCVHG